MLSKDYDGNDPEYYSINDFEKVDKIDMHLHINTYGLFLIEQAREDNFRILTINVDYPAFPPVEEQLDIAVKLSNAYPETLAYATTFYMEGWNEADWQKRTIKYIEKVLNGGSSAVKVWKNVGMSFRDKTGKLVMIDDPKFDPIFSFLKKLNVPLIGHLGEPRDCWLPVDKMMVNYLKDYYSDHPEYHMFKHPEFPSYGDHIAARDRMLDKNMDLVFIGAHFASLEWNVDKIAGFLDKFPCATVDSAARMGEIQCQTIKDREKVRNFFIKYQDRIMYATDTFQEPEIDGKLFKEEIHEKWKSDWRFLVTDDQMTVSNIDKPFYGLKLPKILIDKIYKTNAQRIFPTAWQHK